MVTDFIEYERDKFFVSVLKDDYFYLVTRFVEEKQMGRIKSISNGYLTMGLQMLPRYEQTFVVVRDNHGIQLINLETQRSHQWMLSPGQEAFSDLKFLVVLCDDRNAYSITTLFEEEAGNAKLCMYTLSTEFAYGLKSYMDNLAGGRINY